MTATLDDEVAELRRANAELQRQLDEAIARESATAAVLKESLEYQTATSDVLQVISRSTFDLQPVLDTLVETAARLCEADNAIIFRLQEGRYHMAASVGFSPEFREHHARNPTLPGRGTVTGRVAVEHRVVHIEDAATDPEYTATQSQQLGQTRTMLGVPLVREDKVTGVITLSRSRVEPFSKKQIKLVTTFADQAVIAIENARLLTETREALDQQAATAEVLQVINSSPGDLAPVFDAILEKAHSLCGINSGALEIWDGERLRALATRGLPASFEELARRGYQPGPNDLHWQLLDGDRFVHIADQAAVDEPMHQKAVELGGFRTFLGVALRKENTLLGRIVAARQEVRPFAEKEIALLQNFAAQAVIAMENARLINETREALEQQTATTEVLQVINSSPGDLGPVFDAILQQAHTLCGADHGALVIYQDEHFRAVATHGVSSQFGELYRQPFKLAPASPQERLLRGESLVHIPEFRSRPADLIGGAAFDAGLRAVLMLPLRREATLLGYIVASRPEPGPFTDKQIALLKNFADQAVIAIENARLINETREALEQQTATAEVLQVINTSPGDLAPVFDAILEKAHTLCGVASGGLIAIEGERYRALAVHGEPRFAEYWMQQGWIDSATGAFARLRQGEPIHVPDVTVDDEARRSEQFNRLIELSGARSMLIVPLRKDDVLFGAITALRNEVRPFSQQEIALLQNFAAQAVIAMENARLITETREALDQQTATAEVLQVINSSPGDLAPVFDAMLEKAMRLCDATIGALWTYDGEQFALAALRGGSQELFDIFARPVKDYDRMSTRARALRGEHVTHILDARESEAYLSGDLYRRAMVDLGGGRTMVTVSLRRDDTVLGIFTIYRQEVRPFSDKQIALLENFAAQAVIAMENARLITETREALEQQTATTEVLQVINSSPGDLAPVFDAMLEKATVLCEASFGILMTYDGEIFQTVALRRVPAAYAEYLRKPIYPAPQNGLGRLLSGERLIHIEDIRADEAYRTGDPLRVATADLGGSRTHLVVPLLKDDILLGVIVAYRQEVRPFTDKQIALLQNFAAQAVIAMENARLLTETREALEQQTATAEVLQVINSSPGDLAPVFDAMLEKAMRLCGAVFGELRTYDGERFWLTATRGVPAPYAEYYAAHDSGIYGPGTGPARILDGERFVHIVDLVDTDPYRSGDPNRRALVHLGGARALLLVPLLKGASVLGYIMIYRQEPSPFPAKQIALLQNFAAQAVIAMENARLITETREALDQQTATAEVLQVINSSPGDLAPVFDAMLERAMRLCEAACGHLWRFDGETISSVSVRGEPRIVEFMRQTGPVKPAPGSAVDRLVGGEPLVHMLDPTEAEPYRTNPVYRRLIDEGHIRTSLAVPLRKDRALLGAIIVYRQEVRAFSEKQIALLQNFAAQAVIAMENARLITETREALEQQTATSEVLQVINASPGDLKPVFEAMLERATSLCGAAFGVLWIVDADQIRAAASHKVPVAYRDFLTNESSSPGPRSGVAQTIREKSVLHFVDAASGEAYRSGDPFAVAAVELGGVRTLLNAPLIKDGNVLGILAIYRKEVRSFTDKQIALLQNFAAQAVIAMENARLITETREALEQQTATAEVLQVINSSPGDLVPVFDAMLERATRLCEAAFGTLLTFDGEALHVVAMRNVPKELAEYVTRGPLKPDPNSLLGQSVLERRTIHTADNAAEDPYRTGAPLAVAAVELGGIRTVLHVPLIKDAEVLGVFIIFRQEVRPFSDKQIALLQNFAAQAVIAIENARLITETREALEQQTATAEILRVISGSPTDVQPTFDAIATSATILSGAASGSVYRFDGSLIHLVANYGYPPDVLEAMQRSFPCPPGQQSTTTRAILTREVVHIPDVAADPEYALPAIVQTGWHTALAVPILRDGNPVGAITVVRPKVEPFSQAQMDLLKTFADQAVIAIENVRLFNEIRQRQAELRVTFDNMADGVVMFDEDLRLAAWNRNFQELLDLPDAVLAERPSYADYLRILAKRGEFGTDDIEAELSRRLEETDQELRLERTRPDGRVIEVRRNSVPDGGFVLIYSDITERKRSEAKIRSARDAAEAAYRDLKAAQANLIQAEKMASLGQLTAGIAHEIKNPLNFVNNFADLSVELLDELKETTAPAIAALGEDKRAEVDETMVMLTGNLEKIAEHGRRADGIVKSMLEHSRGGTGERRSVDLNRLIEEALNLAYHGARAQDQTFNVTLERDFAHGIAPIELVPQDITRVCLNLIGNGFYAATKCRKEESDPRFQPILKVTTRDLGDAVEIRVRDNGTGIAPEIKDKLFQPFFTTKPTGQGTGLGLSISYDIITQQHGGTIEVDSRVGEFTEFTVRLPRAYRTTMAEAAAWAPSAQTIPRA